MTIHCNPVRAARERKKNSTIQLAEHCVGHSVERSCKISGHQTAPIVRTAKHEIVFLRFKERRTESDVNDSTAGFTGKDCAAAAFPDKVTELAVIEDQKIHNCDVFGGTCRIGCKAAAQAWRAYMRRHQKPEVPVTFDGKGGVKASRRAGSRFLHVINSGH